MLPPIISAFLFPFLLTMQITFLGILGNGDQKYPNVSLRAF